MLTASAKYAEGELEIVFSVEQCAIPWKWLSGIADRFDRKFRRVR